MRPKIFISAQYGVNNCFVNDNLSNFERWEKVVHKHSFNKSQVSSNPSNPDTRELTLLNRVSRISRD